MAEAGQAAGQEESSEPHGCCPGDDAGAAEGASEQPDSNESDHVCSHCADDVFTPADVASLVVHSLTPPSVRSVLPRLGAVDVAANSAIAG